MRTPVLLDHRGRPIERKALTQEVNGWNSCTRLFS